MTSEMTKPPSSSQEEIDFLKDRPRRMTWGRRLALWLSQYEWYYPSNDDDDGERPSLAKAWAFFEHVTLERYVVHRGGVEEESEHYPAEGKDTTAPKLTKERVIRAFHKGDRRLNIAEPGEKLLKSKLYSPLTTPLSQLGDFGLGYGLYFSTLRAFALLALLAGLLNIPNLLYFASDDYSNRQPGVTTLLKGSAICTERKWVACPTCDHRQFQMPGAYGKARDHAEYTFVPSATGDFLNITDYLDWPALNGSSLTYEEWFQFGYDLAFTNETFQRLEEDFGLMIGDDEITLEGANYSATCEIDCLYDFAWCQDDTVKNVDTCYVYLPGYGDSESKHFGFALKNQCEGATLRNGFINYATVFLFLVGMVVIQRHQNRLEVEFDEDEQTAQDYSIVVLNPPDDAYDPEEWKDFFEGAFDCKVTVCTVDLANDAVVQSLIQRREILRMLEIKLPPGTPLDRTSLSRLVQRDREENGGGGCCGGSGIAKLYEQLQDADKRIKTQVSGMKELPTTNVFITFETEKAQRDVLEILSVGTLVTSQNSKDVFGHPKYLFRGEHMLEVHEPEEPSAICWQELNATRVQKVGSLVGTSLVTVAFILAAFLIISAIYSAQLPFVASIVTAVLTSLFPMVAKVLMGKEYHHSESSRQTWLFIKISIFNVLITACLLSLITPFTATLDKKEGSLPGLIPAVHALFFSQLGVTPVLQLLDIGGNIQRHLMAPRAKTQEEMNMNMLGTPMYLAERYANLMKFMFLMLWYCAIYPAAFFMGAFALIIAYFADRFSLMRSWARSPQLGVQISNFARFFFTPTAITLMAVLSAYAWSGFPYDNLCEDTDSELSDAYAANWTVDLRGSNITLFGYNIFTEPDVRANFQIEAGDTPYKFCNQDMRSYDGRSFPPLPRFQSEGDEWMTIDQEQVVRIFGWTSVGILAVVVASFLFRMRLAILACFQGSYKSRGDDQQIPFSEVPAIDSYVPQAHSPLFPYPLLLCDIQDIDESLFSWTDPDRPHSHYDVTQDLKTLLDDASERGKSVQIFSQVKHWPSSARSELS